MKLSLRNIGKIDDASVEIEGITVIAGENNIGKSTVGRVLFSVFHGFFDIEGQIKRECVQSVGHLIDVIYGAVTNRLTSRVDTRRIAQDVMEQRDLFKNDIGAIKNGIIKSIIQYDVHFEKHLENTDIDEMILRIQELLNISDSEIFQSICAG